MDELTRRRLLPEGVTIPPEARAGAMRIPDPVEQMPLRIGKRQIDEAASTLQKYKDGKANLEARVVEDELWWELRHWEAIGRKKPGCRKLEPTSAWLFNMLINKHADAMDNLPSPVVLPREQSDEESADILSSVIPVVLEQNDFDQVADAAWWEKLKHGTATFFCGWNNKKNNGLGDIEIRQIDLLNLFWEPGITDIQQSRNLFIVELVDEDLLDQQYPQHKGKMGGQTVDVKKYCYDETIDLSQKSLVVDWYYKTEDGSGRTILHYAKFVGDVLLYASENDPALAQRGFYDHGLYPVITDTLFPEKGMPVGFGYIAICKDPQMYIDKIYGSLLEYTIKASKPRAWVLTSAGVNEKEYLDWDKPFVHVEGTTLDERGFRDLVMPTMPGNVIDVIQLKIDEMKETSANRDMSSGGTAPGVTAAAAIAALQEAGNKVSRDMISAHYRSFSSMVEMVIELMRQFYDEKRSFRIVSPNNPSEYAFVEMDNSKLRDQPMGGMYPGQTEMLYRKPGFDIKVSAQKKSPFARAEENERAKELFQMGFFNPDLAQQAMGALQMMDFEGIDEVREYVSQGQTLMELVQQLTAAVQQLTRQPLGDPGAPAGGGMDAPAAKGMDRKRRDAQTRGMTPYGQRLASGARPDMGKMQ